MRIEVERIEPSRLERQVWEFEAIVTWGRDAPLVLRLEAWRRQGRKTARHKWETRGEAWVHRPHNGQHHYWGRRLAAADVPFPPDVVEEARAALLARLTITGPVDPPKEST